MQGPGLCVCSVMPDGDYYGQALATVSYRQLHLSSLATTHLATIEATSFRPLATVEPWLIHHTVSKVLFALQCRAKYNRGQFR